MKKLGIDIGGTSIKGGIVENGIIINRVKVPTDAKLGVDKVMSALYSVIDSLLPFADDKKNVGISTTGDVNPTLGEIVYATNTMPGYTGFNLKNAVAKKYNLNVQVINDCAAALIGECAFGAAKGMSDVVMLTLGTGLGGAALCGGKLILGSNYRASRLGHTIIRPNGRLCPCGKKGCAETYVSATGLLKTAREYGLEYTDCNKLFTHKDKDILSIIIDEFTDDLAIVINNYIAVYDPSCMVIGGGLIFLSDYYWDKTLEKVDNPLVLRKSLLGNDSGVIGATISTDYNIIT